jgi:threonine/homoserine efflux transporter RhtA
MNPSAFGTLMALEPAIGVVLGRRAVEPVRP